MPKGCHQYDLSNLQKTFQSSTEKELSRIKTLLNSDYVNNKVAAYFEQYDKSLRDNIWKDDIPGKQIFRIFCNQIKMEEDRLKTLYIQKAIQKKDGPFAEILTIFKEFSIQ